jgi:hypothetical protein
MRSRRLLAASLLALLACSSDASSSAPPSPPAWSPTPGSWQPGEAVATERLVGARGLLDRKGLVHAHSVYSHDACDGQPRGGDGKVDAVCLDELRRALCAARLDFVFLTDHLDSFADTPFRDALLYEAGRGDRLVERGGEPTASWAGCPDQDAVLVLAGTEAGTMPVGLERHVGATAAERGAAYDAKTPEGLAAVKAAGAVALVAHTEDWTVDQLTNLPFDGFEMFNLHANALVGAGPLLTMLNRLGNEDVRQPHPALVFLPVVSEDPRYLSTWGSVLARGARRVTTLGSDCHRNTFRQILSDGDRIDSYKRVMSWFSNHLLVRPEQSGAWDDRQLKEALRAGRLYGVFDMLGSPKGFDFHAKIGAETREMGDEVELARKAVLHVSIPSLERLDPAAEPPALTARVLRAKEGGWDVVATSAGAIDFTADRAGAYRAEIRMVPRHLRPYLGDEESFSGDPVWIYSNAIYVK